MTVNETTAVTNESKTTAPQRKGVSVALNDVHLAFGSNKVLRGISFEVPAATTACLIGPSGSGKSTTLRIVNRLAE